MNIGNNIKKIRIKKEMTQESLAEKSGISRVAIGNYERDDRSPNIHILNKIAEALGVDPRTLMSDKNFSKEILNRAFYLALPTLPPGACGDVFSYLELWTGDYESLLDLWNGNIKSLNENCLRGLLKFIAESAPIEFKKIYQELILNGIYDISNELELFASYLVNSANQLFTYNISSGEIKPQQGNDKEKSAFYNINQYYKFLKLRILELSEESNIPISIEESNSIVEHVDNLINFELYKLKNKQKNI